MILWHPVRLTLYVCGLCLLGLAALLISWLVWPINTDQLNWPQQYLADQTVRQWESCLQAKDDRTRSIISYEDSLNCLNWLQRAFAERILALDPRALGFKGEFTTREPATDLTFIPGRTVSYVNQPIVIEDNYLPTPVWQDYVRLRDTMRAELGATLLVESGYRSPGYQAYLFFFYLVRENGYSLKENAKWVAFPGYSEHNALTTALDFITEDGVSGEDLDQTADDFVNRVEYTWQVAHAAEYNFYLSYPPQNTSGIEFEPWHWRWQKKS